MQAGASSRSRWRRQEAVLRRLVRTFRVASRDETFRVVHFSVQADHVHMIVEASSREALTKRMTGLTNMGRAADQRRHGS